MGTHRRKENNGLRHKSSAVADRQNRCSISKMAAPGGASPVGTDVPFTYLSLKDGNKEDGKNERKKHKREERAREIIKQRRLRMESDWQTETETNRWTEKIRRQGKTKRGSRTLSRL